MMLANEATEKDGKVELVNAGIRLIPQGVVNFESLYDLQPITDLVTIHGTAKVQTLIFTLIQNFCKSFNVVRNMEQDQMIECAMVLLSDCKDFRLEDYVIMFTLAKRMKIGNVYDHIDLAVISTIHDEYLVIRQMEMKKINERKKNETRKVKAIEQPVSQDDLDKAKESMRLLEEELRKQKTEDNSVADWLKQGEIKFNNLINESAEKKGL